MRARYQRAVIDLGTGDGRFVLGTAAAFPESLVLGIDANAAAMMEASRRAAKSVKRGGLPNAVFVVAAAESLPNELTGLADAVTVHFPWGSLLRGLLSADRLIMGNVARIARPGGTVTAILSVTPRDHLAGLDSLESGLFDRLAPGYAACGLTLTEARPATSDEIDRTHSTWAKRLGAGTNRPAWLVRLRRTRPADQNAGVARGSRAEAMQGGNSAGEG